MMNIQIGSYEHPVLLSININDALYANNHLYDQKLRMIFLKTKTITYYKFFNSIKSNEKVFLSC